MCIYLKFTLSKMAEKYQTDYPSLVWKRPKKIVVPVNLFKLFGVDNTFAREVCHLCIIRKKHMKLVYTSFTFFILPMVQVVRKKKLHNYCFQSLLIITVVPVKKKQPVPVVQVNKKRTIRQYLCKFFWGGSKVYFGLCKRVVGPWTAWLLAPGARAISTHH